MKKIILAALALVVAFTFTACESPELTKEELLIQKKGWTLYTATSIPAYKNYEGVTSENLLVSYFIECELDDILYFYENKSSIMNFGKKDCEGQVGKDASLGNWRFLNDNVLEFHLPYFCDESDNLALLEGKVIVLDEETLQLRVPVVFYGDPAKSQGKIRNDRGIRNAKGDDDKFEFTFTYKAK